MNNKNLLLNLDDILIMKKNHACGGNEWKVTRLGVDIKLECQKCHHEIMIDRLELFKKVKKKVGNTSEEK